MLRIFEARFLINYRLRFPPFNKWIKAYVTFLTFLTSVICFRYSVPGSMFPAQCSRYNVSSTMFPVQCSRYNVSSTVFPVQCFRYSVYKIQTKTPIWSQTSAFFCSKHFQGNMICRVSRVVVRLLRMFKYLSTWFWWPAWNIVSLHLTTYESDRVHVRLNLIES